MHQSRLISADRSEEIASTGPLLGQPMVRVVASAIIFTGHSEEIATYGASGDQHCLLIGNRKYEAFRKPAPCKGCDKQSTWLLEDYVARRAFDSRASRTDHSEEIASTGPLVINNDFHRQSQVRGLWKVNFMHRCTGYSEEIASTGPLVVDPHVHSHWHALNGKAQQWVWSSLTLNSRWFSVFYIELCTTGCSLEVERCQFLLIDLPESAF
jgi:hypothetical protein